METIDRQMRIALSTLKCSEIGARILGMSIPDAINILLLADMSRGKIVHKLKGYGHTRAEINRYFNDENNKEI